MPNQRKKTKVHLGGYYERDLHVELKRMAKDKGVTLSALVEEILEEGVKDYKRRKPEASALGRE